MFKHKGSIKTEYISDGYYLMKGEDGNFYCFGLSMEELVEKMKNGEHDLPMPCPESFIAVEDSDSYSKGLRFARITQQGVVTFLASNKCGEREKQTTLTIDVVITDYQWGNILLSTTNPHIRASCSGYKSEKGAARFYIHLNNI